MKNLTSSLLCRVWRCECLLPLTSCFCLLLLSSCRADLRELCYDHHHSANVTVGFNWTSSVATSMTPQGMTVLFYNTQQASQEPERYDFAGMGGGTARLIAGSYRAMAYNYDTETILYRGRESAATLEAYTRSSSIEEGTQMAMATRGFDMPRASGTEDEPVILEPDALCGAVSEDFSLATNDAGNVTVTPEMRTHVVTITITNVPNLQYTYQFGASLTGMAGSVNMQSGRAGDEPVTQAFTGYAADVTTLVFRFRSFGHCPRHSEGVVHSHMFTVYAILADGSKWYYTEDISGQMHNWAEHPEDEDISIVLDELPIPKPIVNGSGFQPTIDGWQGIEIEVGM